MYYRRSNEETSMEKTVFILGAGASVSAGLPTQAGILTLIFTISKDSFSTINTESDFLSLKIDDKEQRIEEFYPKFDEFRQSLGRFIVVNFSSAEKAKQYLYAIEQASKTETTTAEDIAKRDLLLKKAYEIAKTVNVTLEDLFTIFDNVSAGREHFRLYSPQKMLEIHNQLKLCIIYALSYSINENCNSTDYSNFAKALMEKRLSIPQAEDAMSVITMNWDDILEHSLFKLCHEHNSKLTKNQQKILPDLCFYNYDLGQSKDHIPSIHIKAKKIKNIKILKMHGSLAWLECPKCGRIFTDFAEEIASEEFSEIKCPKCSIESSNDGENPVLRNLIITPTFMKSLDNLNVKNIWQNASIDISEADHLVFIGYSFPDADFEMRCLLKKSVKNSADITVVLTNSDNPHNAHTTLLEKGFSEEEANVFVQKMHLPAERYISFFGEDKVTFNYGGFNSYINEMRNLK